MIHCGSLLQAPLDAFNIRILQSLFLKQILTNGRTPVFSGLLFLVLAIPSLGWGQEIKAVTVETQLMRFPGIPIDGIDYQALSYEYASQGQAGILAVEKVTESEQCSGETRASTYLRVDYQGPEVIFRITDSRKGRVLLLQELNTSGSIDFGREHCGAVTDVEAEFAGQRAQWLTALTEELMVRSRQEMEQYIQENIALEYESLMLPLFYVVSESSAYSDMNQAFDLARAAFDLNLEFGVTMDAQKKLNGAVAVWKSELKRLDKENNRGPSTGLVWQALYRNLTVAHLALNNFEQARRNDALALARGMPAQESLQPLILAHERRQILSPQVAGNLVLMANLYRYGRNALIDALLVESDDFASFKQALTQN